MNEPQFGFDVQTIERTKKAPPPPRPIRFEPGCATCGGDQKFAVAFTCPGCGHDVQKN